MTLTPKGDAIGKVVLGRYRIVRRLAHGGMGAVYLGRTEGAEGFARPVVIKRVLPGLTDDREVSQMFVREARILANLQHPNIVPVLDFGQQDDGAYLMVLEYVHGYQLAEWHTYVTEARTTFPVEFACYIVCKVLDALHYAHTFRRADGKALQIIHRDVTPTNVLLSDQAEVKLVDFGIARASGDEQVFLTERAQVKGKLPYLPLEAFRGLEPTVESDVYSTGVVLYELLTGINPFVGRDTADIYTKILGVEPVALHELRDDCPPALDAVLKCAMHKDTAQRFASAAEFAQALRALRQQPEDAIASEFARQVREDFYGELPEQLALERLTARELAWRGDEAATVRPPADATANTARAEPGEVEAEPEPLDNQHATVRASIPQQLLNAAYPSITPPAAANVPSDEPRPAAGLTISRAALAAAVAAAIGAAVALLAWFAVAPSQPVRERMVVIAREAADPAPRASLMAAKPADAAVAKSDAQAQKPEPETEPSVAVAVAQPSAPSEPATSEAPRTSGRAPAVPDPKVLTRVFERRQKAVQRCFVKYAGALPSVPQVSVHFHVRDSGQVDSAQLDPPELSQAELGRCLLQVARATRFGPLQHAVSFHIPISAEKIVQTQP